MRRTGKPCYISNDGKYQLLKRVEYSDRHFAEDLLQETLDKCPPVLPINEIDMGYGPVASLGREIDDIDNLFISPSGKITLVETKLWRNPESIREVVGQIIEYASRLSSWSYSELEAKAQRIKHTKLIGGSSLYDYVAKEFPEEILPEPQFIDEVQKNLKAGRILLLVVGDGIRKSVEQLTEYFNRYPQLLFQFALVELHIYTNPNVLDGQVVMPLVVANTVEIRRAVVRVVTTGEAKVSVEIDDSADNKPSPERRTLSEDLFYEEIKDEVVRDTFREILSFADEIGAAPVWRSQSVSVLLPDPNGSSQNLSLLVLTTSGEIYTWCLAGQLKKVGLSEQIAADYVKSLCDVFPQVKPSKKRPDMLSRNLTASEVSARLEDFISVVKDTVDKIKGR